MLRTIVLTSLAVLACRSPRNDEARGDARGQLAVEWQGSVRGRFGAPASARWCARDTLLEIIAVRSDTAFGLTLLAQDSLRAGAYPVFQAKVFTPWRPQSAAALRLFTPTSMLGFESTRGQVTVTEGGSRRASGTLDVWLRVIAGSDSVHLTGRFTGLDLAPAQPACGRGNKPGIA